MLFAATSLLFLLNTWKSALPRVSLFFRSSVLRGMWLHTWFLLRWVPGRKEGALLLSFPGGDLPQTRGQGCMMWSDGSQSHMLVFGISYTLPNVDFFSFLLLIGHVFSCPSLSNWLGWTQQYILSASILNWLLLSDVIFGFLYIDYFPLIYLFLADIYQHSSEHADECNLLSVIRLFFFFLN